jgi:hypothetical protein
MRTYTPAFTALLTGEQVLVDNLAMAIQLELVSGDVIRLAEVTEDTEIGAHVWSPAPGLKRGSVEIPINEGPGSIDLEFMTDPTGPLKYEDVQDGLLDAAVLTVYAFNRANLADGLNVIWWGDVTDIRRGNFGAIEISAEGPTNRQTDVMNKTYQFPCRNIFTSPECGIDPATVTYDGTVVSADSRFITVEGTGGQGDDFFNVGLFRLTSGRLKGRAREIRLSVLSGSDQELELYRDFGGIDPQPGDTCTVRRGCTHDFSETHGNRFYNNARRYGGEPRLEADDSDVVHVAAEATDEGG